MNSHTLTYLNKKYSYSILNNLEIDLTIEENPYSIPLEQLFTMAARINKKRAFLFVSRVLGKHIPIRPEKGLLTGFLLAARYMEKVRNETVEGREELVNQFMNIGEISKYEPFVHKEFNPIIIGFAETATALGHAFFDAFFDADFFHTTREYLKDASAAITFEEEHSHATSHRAYIDDSLLDNKREIILVDDEVTTGKTALNIIRSIQKKFPRETYTVVSILDWRSAENRELFKETEGELGIKIQSVSLLKGTFSLRGGLLENENRLKKSSPEIETKQRVLSYYIDNPSPILHVSVSGTEEENQVPYLLETGRFGLNAEKNALTSAWLKKIGRDLKKLRTGKRTLCLGTGEFMYIPMKIAYFMGEGVFYHSTTRSPIYPFQKENYGVFNRFSFSNPEDRAVPNFLYNILENQYDEIFLFFEREVEKKALQEMLKQLERTKISEIKIVFFSRRAGGKNVDK